MRSCLLFSTFLTTSLYAERRCCSTASIRITCCSGYCSRPCMDHQCDVSYIFHLAYIGELSMGLLCFSFLLPAILINFICFSHRFLKAIDRFNDLVVSVYVTAGHILYIYGTDLHVHNI